MNKTGVQVIWSIFQTSLITTWTHLITQYPNCLSNPVNLKIMYYIQWFRPPLYSQISVNDRYRSVFYKFSVGIKSSQIFYREAHCWRLICVWRVILLRNLELNQGTGEMGQSEMDSRSDFIYHLWRESIWSYWNLVLYQNERNMHFFLLYCDCSDYHCDWINNCEDIKTKKTIEIVYCVCNNRM